MKKRKPVFARQQSEYVSSLEKKQWRAPKGMHSKLRRNMRGKMKHPSIGYSSPSKVRYLHPSGFIPILVHNADQLDAVGKEYGIILSARVGQRKRLDILKRAHELGLNVLNIKNTMECIRRIEDERKKRKEEKTKAHEMEEKKEIKSVKEERKDLTLEEKDKLEKEEKRKILESRR